MTHILLGPVGSSVGHVIAIPLVALIFGTIWIGFTIPPVSAGLLTGGVCSRLFRYSSAWPGVNLVFNMGFVSGSAGLWMYNDAFGLLPTIPGPWWGFLAVLSITVAIATAITCVTWWRRIGMTSRRNDNADGQEQVIETEYMWSGRVIFAVSLGLALSVVIIGSISFSVAVFLYTFPEGPV